MNWKPLTDLSQLDTIVEESNHQPVLIFKHSHSCSISKATLNRLERNWKIEKGVKPYFLDLLTYRDISHAVAHKFDVHHESPQVIIINGGRAVYDRSHFDINYQEIKEKVELVAG